MSDKSHDISVELPEHLLEKLGENPSEKILELIRKHIEISQTLSLKHQKRLISIELNNPQGTRINED